MSCADNPLCEIFEIKNTCEDYGGDVVQDDIVIEFTLNHPHTKAWAKLSEELKRRKYMSFYFYAYSLFAQHLTQHDIAFEDTGNHFHAHGYLRLAALAVPSACGLLCTLTEAWLRELPKRYNHCLTGNPYDHYDPRYQRLTIPQCCMQFRTYDPDRFEHWRHYIRKMENLFSLPTIDI